MDDSDREWYCDPDNSNCYDTSHYQTETYEEISSMSSSDVSDIIPRLIKMLETKIRPNREVVYRISLRTFNYRPNGKPGINKFNHSFLILRLGNNFELCDSWEGIHTFKCRETDVISWLIELSEDLSDKSLTQPVIDLFTDFDFDLDPGEYESSYPKPHDFEGYELTVTTLE
jgi:hypothetical protein